MLAAGACGVFHLEAGLCFAVHSLRLRARASEVQVVRNIFRDLNKSIHHIV
jgi:hypothetical protein